MNPSTINFSSGTVPLLPNNREYASNPRVEVNASHIYTTPGGIPFVKTSDAFTKRRRLSPGSLQDLQQTDIQSARSVRSLPEGPQTRLNRPLVLENATGGVWSTVQSYSLDFVNSLNPQRVLAEVEYYKQQNLHVVSRNRTRRTTSSGSTMTTLQLALADRANQPRAPRIIIPTNLLPQGRVTIKYTREQRARWKAEQERIWRETRFRKPQRVPSDYKWQPKITTPIVEEDEPTTPTTVDEPDDFPVDDSSADDALFSDDDEAYTSNATVPPLSGTVFDNDDDATTVSDVDMDVPLTDSPSPPPVTPQPPMAQSGTNTTRTRQRRRRVPPPPMVESSMEHITDGYGSMYIIEERYPRQVVRRSCRTYPMYQPGKYKC